MTITKLLEKYSELSSQLYDIGNELITEHDFYLGYIKEDGADKFLESIHDSAMCCEMEIEQRETEIKELEARLAKLKGTA